mmetsp:Transcript_14650/g.36296  ORF Transcript_14650/g.36296 Transcript_14650/m.36296 type:complete len:320 (+) Transcript_14650:39-998(+)
MATLEEPKPFAPLRSMPSRVVDTRLLANPVELNLSANSLPNMDFLSKSDPFAVVYARPSSGASGWAKLGITETIWDDLNPKWCTSFILPKEFDGARGAPPPDTPEYNALIFQTALRIEVYDWDKDTDNLASQDFIGSAECVYQDLFDASGHSVTLELKDPKKRGKSRGTLTLTLDVITKPDPPVQIGIEVTVTEPAVSNKKSAVIVSRMLRKNVWTPVYRSESIKERAPKFKAFELPLEALSAGEEERSFRVEVYKVKRNNGMEHVGFFLANVAALRSATPGTKLQYWSPNSGLQLGGATVTEVYVTPTYCSWRVTISG